MLRIKNNKNKLYKQKYNNLLNTLKLISYVQQHGAKSESIFIMAAEKNIAEIYTENMPCH